ncbi:hypothetical protein JMM81_11365 [Bacillus sp. V3B]|uniref:hypothetical protein n=1 Tax=Bacillus sp. V3B TaxID=2804915 RepID=UPI00210CD470|nr:hypothetical protein [Bacillus sp. V3B]MCQ6275556.1 hypothetical protein [Bacillus sp. V3B]
MLNTDQAFDLLKEVGITNSPETFRRWLREGKIKATGFTVDDQDLKLFINEQMYQDKDETIRQLKLKIKAQDQYIEGIEELHKISTKEYIKQRDQLNKEIIILKNEQSKLQKETMDLLRENIKLRDRLIELKENKRDNHHSHPTSSLDHYSQKLGLSKMASNKEVLTGFKALLKRSHPDQGGDAKLFQYLKTDYDHFRKGFTK